MRLLKWLGLGLAATLLIGGASLLVLRRRYPPQRLRALALAEIEPVVGRKLKIASISLGLRGVELGGLEVSASPDFSAGTFFKAKRITAGWSLRALLERRVMISELLVSDFDCVLKQDAAGKLDVPTGKSPSPAPKKGSASKTAENAAGGGLAITVSRVKFDDGTIHFADASGTKAKVKHLGGAVSGIGTGAELPLTLEFDYSVERPGSKWSGKAEAVGTVKTGETMEALLAPLELSLGDSRLRWEGRVRYAKGRLEATLAPLELGQGGLHLILDGKVSRSEKGAVKLSAKGKLPALSAEDLKRLGANAVGSLALPMGTAELELGWSDGRLTLSPAIVTLGAAKIDARGTVRPASGKDGGALDLKLKTTGVPIITLAPLVSILRTYLVLGRADLDLKVTGRPDAPLLAGEGKVSDLAATINGFALRGGSLTLAFDAKRLKAGLNGTLAGAALALDVDAKDYANSPDVRVDGKLASLDLGPWAAREAAPEEPAEPKPAKGENPQKKGAAKPLAASGKLAIGPVKHPNFQAESVSFEWSLDGITPDLSLLHGKTALRVGKGKFDKLDVLAAKSELAKVALFPLLVLQRTAGLVKLPLFPAFDKVAFTDIAGDYVFAKGVMTVKESHMDSSAGYVTTTGTADLAHDKLDLRIAAKLGGPLQGRISGPLAFFVRGSLSNPEVKADIAAVLKQPGVEQVIDQGKKLLQGIFK